MKVIDPVYKMSIEDKDAVASTTFKGINCFFCPKSCKDKFTANPARFLMKSLYQVKR